mmetsp:Transcript_93476/g.227091  ORF Transcript_93476/g.227091 Transcript_93476/m.227091 type:complete len:612 (+) Transcript_93476:124-1959(+)
MARAGSQLRCRHGSNTCGTPVTVEGHLGLIPLALLRHPLADEVQIKHLRKLSPADHLRVLIQRRELRFLVDGLVDVAIKLAQRRLEVPVRETEAIRQGHRVGPDLLEQAADPCQHGVGVGEEAQEVAGVLVDLLQGHELVEPQQGLPQGALRRLLHDHLDVVLGEREERVALGGLEGQHHDLVQRLVERRPSSRLRREARLQLPCEAPGAVPQQPQHQPAHRLSRGLRPQGAAAHAQGLWPQRGLAHVGDGAHGGPALAHGPHRLHQEARRLHREDHVLALGRHGLGGGLRQVAHARGAEEALAAAGLAHGLDLLVCGPGAEGLHARQRGVQLGEAVGGLVIARHDAVAHVGQELLHIARAAVEGVGKRQSLEDAILVQLVVQHRVLARGERVLARGVLEALPPDAEVPHGHGGSVRSHGVGTPDHACSDGHHANVLELGELGRCRNVVAFPRQLLAPGEHVEAGHPHVRESCVANVCVPRVDLGSDLAHLDPRHQVALVIPELHHETMVPVVLALGVQLREDDPMSRCIHPCWPPLDRCQRWRVDDKLVRHGIESCGRLQRADVRAVPKLGLRVRANVLQIPSTGQPSLLLLIVGLRLEEGQEGHEVDPQ